MWGKQLLVATWKTTCLWRMSWLLQHGGKWGIWNQNFCLILTTRVNPNCWACEALWFYCIFNYQLRIFPVNQVVFNNNYKYLHLWLAFWNLWRQLTFNSWYFKLLSNWKFFPFKYANKRFVKRFWFSRFWGSLRNYLKTRDQVRFSGCNRIN